MQLINSPKKIVLPWASAGAKNEIPVESQIGITAGAGSYTDGYPPLTRTPIEAGGKGPSGLDTNGILYALSAITRWASAGAGYPYDAVFAADSNVGGYPKGARILRTDGAGYWLNTADGNTANPEASDSLAAGWVPDFTSGAAFVAMTSANVTLTPVQYGKSIIVISGLLTTDLSLIFPNIAREWAVINNTTGAHTITCKTLAGSGVAIAQAQIIIGDATNIYIASSSGGSVPSSDPNAFYKAIPTSAAFSKTGVFSVETAQQLVFNANGTTITIPPATSVAMPGSPVLGSDYAIWLKPGGALEATGSFISPPIADSRVIGGFHYAPGGNATSQSGGNSTPQINEYSFWDLKYRPACPDPRGMTCVAGSFWVDIYITGVNAITNGSSKYNVVIADNLSPPKVPAIFGGNGSTTYGSYTWFEAQELAISFGKRCLTQNEFMAATYGTSEQTSIGSDVGSTILNSTLTSKWGVIQATGVMWVMGGERGGPAGAASWSPNTDGRGAELNAPNISLFGGYWGSTTTAGSRSSLWQYAASFTNEAQSSRFACNHIQSS